MASTNASGTTTVRYGSMRAHVLALQVVLADGIVSHGPVERKSSAGYDLTSLFVGAEGTLGVITELTLPVHQFPSRSSRVGVAFPDVDDAGRTAVAIVVRASQSHEWSFSTRRRCGPSTAYKGTSYVEAPTLFVELAGIGGGSRRRPRGDSRAGRSRGLHLVFGLERDPPPAPTLGSPPPRVLLPYSRPHRARST